jgi:uncharacterized membrane protein YebE (DUF533 family)
LNSSASSLTAAVGGSVGGIAAAAVVGLVAYKTWMKRKNRKEIM